MPLRLNTSQLHQSAGLTLVEILVAVVVLSIGLLGLAGLQAAALRNNHSAYLRSQATVFGYDMADRMRANPIAISNGNYDSPAATAVSACLNAAGCTPAQMATHDMSEWSIALANTLPGGTGVVCIDATPDDGTQGAPACDGTGSVYAVKVWWQDDRTGTPMGFVMSVEP
jgi:type IV pilus assembly protein PilV